MVLPNSTHLSDNLVRRQEEGDEVVVEGDEEELNVDVFVRELARERQLLLLSRRGNNPEHEIMLDSSNNCSWNILAQENDDDDLEASSTLDDKAAVPPPAPIDEDASFLRAVQELADSSISLSSLGWGAHDSISYTHNRLVRLQKRDEEEHSNAVAAAAE